MSIDIDSVKAWIKKCEGFKDMPYLDSVRKLTIGFGRNLQDNGISIEEADYMLSNDINRSIKELEQYSWYLMQPDSVKAALINMNFNLGLSRLLTFRKMIDALINRNYTIASKEALESDWSKQVGDRAKDVALMIREGSDAETGRN